MIRRTETLVEAVNGALRLLGERPLASLDEDRVSALRAKEALGDVLAAIIREFDWNFAQGEAVLPADPAYTAGRFAFGYRLPADCLRVVSVVDVDDAAWQIVDGGAVSLLVTDAAAPRIVYSRFSAEPNRWDALFLPLFQARLAIAVAPALGADTARADRAEIEATRALVRARRADASERGGDFISNETSWVTVRSR